jgi:hypothetical protein
MNPDFLPEMRGYLRLPYLQVFGSRPRAVDSYAQCQRMLVLTRKRNQSFITQHR